MSTSPLGRKWHQCRYQRKVGQEFSRTVFRITPQPRTCRIAQIAVLLKNWALLCQGTWRTGVQLIYCEWWTGTRGNGAWSRIRQPQLEVGNLVMSYTKLLCPRRGVFTAVGCLRWAESGGVMRTDRFSFCAVGCWTQLAWQLCWWTGPGILKRNNLTTARVQKSSI